MDLLPLLGVDVDVVFVTAYDYYTLRAFEVNALDYLLKPVAPERLAVTLSRLAAAQPPAPTRETVTYEDRQFLRLGQERAFVRVRDIVAIELEGDGSTLRLGPSPGAQAVGEIAPGMGAAPPRPAVRAHPPLHNREPRVRRAARAMVACEPARVPARPAGADDNEPAIRSQAQGPVWMKSG
jgi:two-component system LytT family response regulator